MDRKAGSRKRIHFYVGLAVLAAGYTLTMLLVKFLIL